MQYPIQIFITIQKEPGGFPEPQEMSKRQHIFAFELEDIINSFPVFFVRFDLYLFQIILIS